MAQRGRKPKSIATKVAAGNPGKRPLTTLVPAPKAGDMLCPQAVARSERALAYWAMFLSNAAPGHLSPIDAPLLGRLCMCLAYADEANEKIEVTGMMVKAPNTGMPIQSPYLAVMNRQTETCPAGSPHAAWCTSPASGFSAISRQPGRGKAPGRSDRSWQNGP
jgi:hypothetical protein